MKESIIKLQLVNFAQEKLICLKRGIVNRKEEEIREIRTREAMRKNLMGKSGMLGAVAIMLGSPILGQGGDDISYYSDPWELQDDNELPTFGEVRTTLLGWVWDGLREGIHMEIKLSGYGPGLDDPKAFIMDELMVHYQGYLVYHEEHGLLHSYTPTHPVSGAWEHHIGILYERAKKRRVAQEKAQDAEIKKEAPKLAQRILDMLKFKWG